MSVGWYVWCLYVQTWYVRICIDLYALRFELQCSQEHLLKVKLGQKDLQIRTMIREWQTPNEQVWKRGKWSTEACREFLLPGAVTFFSRGNFLTAPPIFAFTWGGKEFAWAIRKVRCYTWGGKVRCNSAAKNHPSARHWWSIIKIRSILKP